VTVTDSLTLPGFSVIGSEATWSTVRTIPVCWKQPNPAIVASREYTPTGSDGIVKAPFASLVTVRVALVFVSVTVI
jgi:hypothetical protein